uniref:Uncharacterized protein n=1 Tax=Anguilla anguilla TaxID=7936 RepID=A0A0E9WIM7_ANGAN
MDKCAVLTAENFCVIHSFIHSFIQMEHLTVLPELGDMAKT